MGKLDGKVAIVTGGGSGIGKETCMLFAKEGASVVIADFNSDNALKLQDGLLNLYPNQACSVAKVNVADRYTVKFMVDSVMKEYGKIDILINNAGIIRDSTLLKMEDKDFDDVIQTNLVGVYNCTRYVAPHMVEKGYGRIITTSSVVRNGNFGQTNYSATKAAVVAMSNTWALELGKKGVHCNCVAPGFIETPMTGSMNQDILEKVRQSVPVKRLGQPSDIAKTFLWLSSEEADYVNGTVVDVNGGYRG